MLTTEFVKAVPQRGGNPGCDYCQAPAEVTMMGYGDDASGNCHWCSDCAMQLVRKIMEDLCELRTAGGRHG